MVCHIWQYAETYMTYFAMVLWHKYYHVGSI